MKSTSTVRWIKYQFEIQVANEKSLSVANEKSHPNHDVFWKFSAASSETVKRQKDYSAKIKL